MRVGFRGRLFGLFLLLFVLVGSVAGLFLERTFSRQIEAAVGDQLWSLTGVARAMVANVPPDPYKVDPIIDSLAREADQIVIVIDAEGRVIGDSRLIIPQLKDAPSFVDASEVEQALDSGRGASRRAVWPFQDQLIVSARPFVQGSGQGVVQTAAPARGVQSLQQDLRTRQLAIGF